MIVGTGGSRIIRRNTSGARRRTLLEVSKTSNDATDDEKDGRRRSNSEYTILMSSDEISPQKYRPKSVRMKTMGQKRDSVTKGKADDLGKESKLDAKRKQNDFKTTWINVVSKDDVKDVTTTQKRTLRKFEETNEMLHQFNNLSEFTFTELQKSYKSHVNLLNSLKVDLHHIFNRVRSLKDKLEVNYPNAFEATREAIEKLKERQRMEIELEHVHENDLLTAKLPEYSQIFGHDGDIENQTKSKNSETCQKDLPEQFVDMEHRIPIKDIEKETPKVMDDSNKGAVCSDDSRTENDSFVREMTILNQTAAERIPDETFPTVIDFESKDNTVVTSSESHIDGDQNNYENSIDIEADAVLEVRNVSTESEAENSVHGNDQAAINECEEALARQGLCDVGAANTVDNNSVCSTEVTGGQSGQVRDSENDRLNDIHAI